MKKVGRPPGRTPEYVLNASFPADWEEKIKEAAAESGITIREFVRDAVMIRLFEDGADDFPPLKAVKDISDAAERLLGAIGRSKERK